MLRGERGQMQVLMLTFSFSVVVLACACSRSMSSQLHFWARSVLFQTIQFSISTQFSSI